MNVQGVANGCRAFLPMMLGASGERELVNVASLASVAPVPAMSAYACSKYAVEGLSEVLAMELDDSNVHVTCVHPGFIHTPIVYNEKATAESMTAEQLGQLQDYYAKNGCEPEVVADAIVKAVRKRNRRHLFVGPEAKSTPVVKRISPALVFRMSIKMARKVGFIR